jgi:hypothetical protein
MRAHRRLVRPSCSRSNEPNDFLFFSTTSTPHYTNDPISLIELNLLILFASSAIAAPRDAHLVHLLHHVVSVFPLSDVPLRSFFWQGGGGEGRRSWGDGGRRGSWRTLQRGSGVGRGTDQLPMSAYLARVPPPDSPRSRFVWSSLEFSCSSIQMIDWATRGINYVSYLVTRWLLIVSCDLMWCDKKIIASLEHIKLVPLVHLGW